MSEIDRDWSASDITAALEISGTNLKKFLRLNKGMN
jgi:lambda repressor-like predicted transcriptional regulator